MNSLAHSFNLGIHVFVGALGFALAAAAVLCVLSVIGSLVNSITKKGKK